MADSRDLRLQIENLIERAQDEILNASRRLTKGFTQETDQFVPLSSQDIQKLVDEVFDFTERVVLGQRRLFRDMVKTLNEQSIMTPRHRRKPAAKKAPAKKAPAKKAPAKKAPGEEGPGEEGPGEEGPGEEGPGEEGPGEEGPGEEGPGEEGPGEEVCRYHVGCDTGARSGVQSECFRPISR